MVTCRVWRTELGLVILEWNPGRRKRCGIPGSTLLQKVEQSLKKTGINNWEDKTKNKKRKLWRKIYEAI